MDFHLNFPTNSTSIADLNDDLYNAGNLMF